MSSDHRLPTRRTCNNIATMGHLRASSQWVRTLYVLCADHGLRLQGLDAKIGLPLRSIAEFLVATALQLRLLGVAGACSATRIPGAPATVLLHLPVLLLVARALLEAQGTLGNRETAQRHPVQEGGLADARRPIGRRVFDDGCRITEKTLVDDRGRLHARPGSASSATRWRTAFSSPTTSPSEHDCNVGANPSSTMA